MLIRAEPLEELIRDDFRAEASSAEECARIAFYLVRANFSAPNGYGLFRAAR